MRNRLSSVWISWEDHRRSRELAKCLGVRFVPLLSASPRFLRYILLSSKTLMLLAKNRPKLVICQNPSIVLAFVLGYLKPIFKYRLIVDRHSNFKIEHEHSNSIKWKVFHAMSRYTLRRADLTIVTNDHLKQVCNRIGGQALVLPDKLPTMCEFKETYSLDFFFEDSGLTNVMVITTFSDDEPIDEIIRSVNYLPENFRFYFTGRYRSRISEEQKTHLFDQGIIFTGFLSEAEYWLLMMKVDVVLVLTTKDFILNCGAYEALSMRKPCVISDTPTLREYFRKGFVYVEPTAKDIAQGILFAKENKQDLIKTLEAFIPILESEWNAKFENVINYTKKI